MENMTIFFYFTNKLQGGLLRKAVFFKLTRFLPIYISISRLKIVIASVYMNIFNMLLDRNIHLFTSVTCQSLKEAKTFYYSFPLSRVYDFLWQIVGTIFLRMPQLFPRGRKVWVCERDKRGSLLFIPRPGWRRWYSQINCSVRAAWTLSWRTGTGRPQRNW